MPEINERVHVWPMPGLRVSSLPPPARRVLPPEGAAVPWSSWLAKRHGAGEISLTDPRPPALVLPPQAPTPDLEPTPSRPE